jgi:hypothetical protein
MSRKKGVKMEVASYLVTKEAFPAYKATTSTNNHTFFFLWKKKNQKKPQSNDIHPV